MNFFISMAELISPFLERYVVISMVFGLAIVIIFKMYFKYRHQRYDGRNPNKCPYCKGRCIPGPNIGPWEHRMETWKCQSCGTVYEFPLHRTSQDS